MAKLRRHHPPTPPPRRWPALPLLVPTLGILLLAGVAALVLWSSATRQPTTPTTSQPAPTATADGPGRLVALTSSIDLGRVPFDRLTEARFRLVNAGGRPLRLLGEPAVKTLAGC